MPKLRVHSIAVSLDGFMAGPDQNLERPMGVGGERLHPWVFATRFGRRMIGQDGGTTGTDNGFLERGDENIGATIIGRNMFGPVRGPWPDEQWRGWWGEEPPYHHPVFVLTHHERDPLVMTGTTFYFVTDGIESARTQAFDAAGGQDVRVGGGASTIRQYLDAGLVDEFHVAVVPTFLGSGERIFDRPPGGITGYTCVEVAASEAVAHLRFVREDVSDDS